MGVDSKAILTEGTTIETIKDKLSEKHDNIKIHALGSLITIAFDDGKDRRQLSVFLKNQALTDYGIPGVLLSLSSYGNAVKILKWLASELGGYVDENDCDDIGFVPVNLEKYKEGREFTKNDLFRLKVIEQLGYENLGKAIELFEEFKTIDS